MKRNNKIILIIIGFYVVFMFIFVFYNGFIAIIKDLTIITTLDWTGTTFILLGNYMVSSKKAFKPKVRLFGLSFFLISNIVWIPFAILLRIEGLLTTQILLMIMNVRGVIILLFKLKKEKNKEK